MKKEWLPNALSVLRLCIVPVLYYLAYVDHQLFVWVFLIAALTDIADGFVARYLNVVTRVGHVLDSVADRVFYYSTFIWIYWLLPHVIQENITIISIFIGVFLVSGVIRIAKRKFLSFHLYSNKLNAILIVVIFAHALIWGYSKIFLYLYLAESLVMFIEEIIILVRAPKRDIRSVLEL